MKSNNLRGRTAVDPDRWLDDHGDYLYRYALFRLRNREAAEDVVQEALLAAVQSHHRYEQRSSERTWLVGILRHKIIDHLRSSNRYNATDLLESENTFESLCFETQGRFIGHWRPDYAPGMTIERGDDVVQQKEFFRMLERCLATLPERMAAAFVLKEVDGMSCDEICEALQVTKANLWVLLHRARLQLRHALEKDWLSSRREGVGIKTTDSVASSSPQLSTVLNTTAN